MAEGLGHRCCCLDPLSGVVAAPLAGWTTTGRVSGSRCFMEASVVAARLHERGRGDHLAKRNAAVLLLVRLWHAARCVTACSCGFCGVWPAVFRAHGRA